MRNALKTLKLDSKNVEIEFEPVDEVALIDREAGVPHVF